MNTSLPGFNSVAMPTLLKNLPSLPSHRKYLSTMSTVPLSKDKRVSGNQFTMGLPSMPPFFVPVPFSNPYNLQDVITPALNILIASPMHTQYNEAETLALSFFLKTKFKEEKFLRFKSKTKEDYIIEPNIGNLYDRTMIWPLKVHQYWWASQLSNAEKHLQSVFGSLKYNVDGGGTAQISLDEAYMGPMHILMANAFTGTLMAELVNKGSRNPTMVLCDLNGPTVDPTVATITSMAAALNIPVTLWKDDTRMAYGGTENPIVMAMSSNQTMYRNQIPLSMWGGAGNQPINPTLMFSYINTVALPLQKVFQEKNNVLLAPTLMDLMKESLWYGLANPFALRGENKYLTYPIKRDPQNPKKLLLPTSARYGRLLAFGELLLTIRNKENLGLQDIYDKFKNLDHSQPTWCLYLGKAQWEFMLLAFNYIYNENAEIFWNNLAIYFDPRDRLDIHFLIKLIIEGSIKTNGRTQAWYIPPSNINI